MKNKDHHTAHAISDKNISIETVNAAKRRLIELAPVDKTVAELGFSAQTHENYQ